MRTRSLLNTSLALSAAALAVALLRGPATPAFAEQDAMASGAINRAGDFQTLTVNIGNEDAVVVLDERSEELFVYRIDSQQTLQLAQRASVPRIFLDARARAAGAP